MRLRLVLSWMSFIFVLHAQFDRSCNLAVRCFVRHFSHFATVFRLTHQVPFLHPLKVEASFGNSV